jgi:hypothetical protein
MTNEVARKTNLISYVVKVKKGRKKIVSVYLKSLNIKLVFFSDETYDNPEIPWLGW